MSENKLEKLNLEDFLDTEVIFASSFPTYETELKVLVTERNFEFLIDKFNELVDHINNEK